MRFFVSRPTLCRDAAIAAVVCASAVAAAPQFQDVTPSADLAGWRVISGEWSVQDGALVGKAASGEAAIVYDAVLADFAMRVDVQASSPVAVYGRGHVLPELPLAANSDPATAPKGLYGYRLRPASQAGAELAVDTFPIPANGSVNKTVELRDGAWNTLALSARRETVEAGIHRASLPKLRDDTFVAGRIILSVGAPNASGPCEARFRDVRVRDFGREGNWRPLWDGKSLAAFEFYGEEEWRALDGGIVGTSGKKKSEGYAKTRETFKDFRVRGKYRMFGDGNYGLFYHSTIAYDDKRFPIISGVQGEVAWGWPSSTGCLYESYKRGWIEKPDMNRVGAYAQDPKLINEIEIMAEGKRRVTWVNGVKVTDLVDQTPAYTEGAFALQLHTGGVSGIMWRDLYVLEN